MFLSLLLSFIALVAAIFATPRRAKVWTTLALVGAGAIYASIGAIRVLASGTTHTLWRSSDFVFAGGGGSMDPLAALFVLIICLGAVAATLYSAGYLAHTLDQKSSMHISLHYTALALMFFAMLGVVCSEGGYTFLFFWELMTIASFVLILYDAQRKEVLKAALSYLIMMHIGFVLLVVGFVSLDAACGSADFATLGSYFATHQPLPLYVLLLAGFGMKAGLFPMHVWLPQAHPAAPSHVSALMSGVMIKMGVYGILRVTAQLTATPALHTAGIILLVVGIVTGLWGIFLASAQNDIKRLLAYSSIENIGVILIGIGIGAIGLSNGNEVVAACGICGALLHTVNHAFFKSLLFFGAGNVLSQTHTTSLDALGGVGRQMPVTATLFMVATTAICALPPLCGFVSELLIYLGIFSGIATGSEVLLSAAALVGLAMIGGLAILTFTKLYGTVFLGAPHTHCVAEASEVDTRRVVAMAFPLAGILLVGFFPQAAVQIVARAATFMLPNAVTITTSTWGSTLQAVSGMAWLLVAVVGALYLLKSAAQRRRSMRRASTWGCGFTAPNVRMQYTGESFAEGLGSIATLTQNSGEGQAVDKRELFPAEHRFEMRHKDKIDHLFAAWWVELLRQINRPVMRLRTGQVNHYVLFALLFLLLIFLLTTLSLI